MKYLFLFIFLSLSVQAGLNINQISNEQQDARSPIVVGDKLVYKDGNSFLWYNNGSYINLAE